MYYETIKSAWLAGEIEVGLPPYRTGCAIKASEVSIGASGLLGFKAKMLSDDEVLKIADLALSECGQTQRTLPSSALQQWLEEGKAVLLTGKVACGKTRFLKAALPDGVYLNGHTTDRSKVNWFWYQVTNDPSRPIIIDEPYSFPELVRDELFKIIKQQGRGYVVVEQGDQENLRADSHWLAMSTSPLGRPDFEDRRFRWINLQSFDGTVASAKWVGKSLLKNQP